MYAIRSHAITFLIDDLLILLIIGSKEGYSLLHLECVFESLVNLPLVVTLLGQDERCRVGREAAVVH